MTLDVPPPDPPTVDAAVATDDAAGSTGDPHREDLQAFLDDDAWERGFDRWAAETDLDEAAWAVVADLEMVTQFDFFWDDFADRVGYRAPGVPEDWQERDLHPALDSWEQVSAINASLTELGRVVADLLTTEYVDWDADYEEPDDLPDF